MTLNNQQRLIINTPINYQMIKMITVQKVSMISDLRELYQIKTKMKKLIFVKIKNISQLLEVVMTR
jgi:hypothetical protein